MGLGVIVWRGGDILLHLRKGGHQPGKWCSPGGHLEHGESFEQCARREMAEECGPQLRVSDLRYWHTVNTVYPEEDKHYVTLFMQADWAGGEPLVMEPDKCERWAWFPWRALPSPLMLGNALIHKAFPHEYFKRKWAYDS